MHAGKLSSDSAAARTYRALLERLGQWVDAAELARLVGSTAIGTRVSEVRRQLAADPVAAYVVDPARMERRGGECRQFYRMRNKQPTVTVTYTNSGIYTAPSSVRADFGELFPARRKDW